MKARLIDAGGCITCVYLPPTTGEVPKNCYHCEKVSHGMTNYEHNNNIIELEKLDYLLYRAIDNFEYTGPIHEGYLVFLSPMEELAIDCEDDELRRETAEVAGD